MNAFTLKELRQLTRARAINICLLVFLVLCFVASYVIPLTEIEARTGETISNVLLLILSIPFLYFLPFSIFHRMRKERKGKSTYDLTLHTSLPPSNIVDGKIKGTLALMALFLVATFPFFLFAYMLHGVDVMQICKMIALLTVGGITLTCLFICVSTSKTPILLGIIFGTIITLYLLPLTIIFCLRASSIEIEATTNWYTITLALSLALIFRAIAISNLSPKTANRDYALRITILVLSIIWILHGIYKSPTEPAALIAIIFIITFIFFIITMRSIAIPYGYSRRMITSLPKNPLIRIISFPFESPAINGAIFAILGGAIIAGANSFITPEAKMLINEIDSFKYAIVPIYLYQISILFLTRYIWSFKHRNAPTYLPLIAIGISAFIQTIPSLLPLLGCSFDGTTLPFLINLNYTKTHILISICVLAITLLLNVLSARKAYNQTKSQIN